MKLTTKFERRRLRKSMCRKKRDGKFELKPLPKWLRSVVSCAECGELLQPTVTSIACPRGHGKLIPESMLLSRISEAQEAYKRSSGRSTRRIWDVRMCATELFGLWALWAKAARGERVDLAMHLDPPGTKGPSIVANSGVTHDA